MKKTLRFLALIFTTALLAIAGYRVLAPYPFSSYEWHGGSQKYIEEIDTTVVLWDGSAPAGETKLLLLLQPGDKRPKEPSLFKTMDSELERVNSSSAVFFSSCEISARSSHTVLDNDAIVISSGNKRLIVEKNLRSVKCETATEDSPTPRR